MSMISQVLGTCDFFPNFADTSDQSFIHSLSHTLSISFTLYEIESVCEYSFYHTRARTHVWIQMHTHQTLCTGVT